VTRLELGICWSGASPLTQSFLQKGASLYVQILEERQGQKISCLEEIAWRNQWIDDSELLVLAKNFGSSPYGTYLSNLVNAKDVPRSK